MTRKVVWGVAAVLAFTAMLALPALADEDDRGSGMRPDYGMSAGRGMGQGMMGGGMGMPPHMQAMLAELSPDKREQLRDLHFGMHRQMIAKRAEMQQARLDLAQVLSKFPLDRDAATAAFQKLNHTRREMFDLRMTARAQVQQIVGKELWEKTHAGGMGGPMGGGMGRGGHRHR